MIVAKKKLPPASPEERAAVRGEDRTGPRRGAALGKPGQNLLPAAGEIRRSGRVSICHRRRRGVSQPVVASGLVSQREGLFLFPCLPESHLEFEDPIEHISGHIWSLLFYRIHETHGKRRSAEPKLGRFVLSSVLLQLEK